MTYYGYDMRSRIRTTIGTKKDYNNDNIDEYIITVKDDWNTDTYIPLLLSPEETHMQDPYPMPYVAMHYMTSPTLIHNVQGDVKEQEAYIDMHIWIPNTDGSSASFVKRISDKIADLIMIYRNSTTSIDSMELLNDGRDLVEMDGKQVIYHRILELYCKKCG